MEFLDTNILVYAASRRREDEQKQLVARALIDPGEFCISLQVLQEFYNAARNPKKLALTHAETVTFCNGWRKQFFVVEPTLAIFDDALSHCDRYQISFFDAAILAAAREMKCRVLYSEDLNHGQNYGGVRVVNPFRGL